MEIRYTAEFKRNLRHLAKRYRNIRNDIDPVLEQLQQRQIVGTQITGIGETLFKVRVRNRDAQRGKSGGYRLIYYLPYRNRIILVTIYSKSAVFSPRNSVPGKSGPEVSLKLTSRLQREDCLG